MLINKLYKFDTQRWCDNQILYDSNEIIKALNNDNMQAVKDTANAYLTVYFNVTKIIGHFDPQTGRHTYTITAQNHRPINNREITKLYDQADQWFDKQYRLYKAYRHAVYQHNQNYNNPNEPSDYEFGQMLEHQFGRDYVNYGYFDFKQQLLYGFGIKFSPIDDWIDYPNYRYTYAKIPRSHNSRSNYGHGRVGHSKSACARANCQRQQSLKQLQNDPNFANTKIRHVNRRYCKRHPIDFPVFDDSEYIEGPFSTGWKHSSKAPHSWLQHTKQKHFRHQDFDRKRITAKEINDWTSNDYLDPDYYALEWWKKQPDPNLTSAHDWAVNNYDDYRTWCQGNHPTSIGLIPNKTWLDN